MAYEERFRLNQTEDTETRRLYRELQLTYQQLQDALDRIEVLETQAADFESRITVLEP